VWRSHVVMGSTKAFLSLVEWDLDLSQGNLFYQSLF
jgi:hypothetical protein